MERDSEVPGNKAPDGGDVAGALSSWDELRTRLSEIARRRVPAEMVEDVVQETLLVISRKPERPGAPGTIDGMPPVAWAFLVLRNVIGNCYRKRRRQAGLWQRVADRAAEEWAHLLRRPAPLEAMETAEGLERMRQAFERLGRSGSPCRELLLDAANGASPAEMAMRLAVDPAALYRRLYRCREKLRAILSELGVDV